MTKLFVNVADLKPAGSDKTYRQLNEEMTHQIPLGALVELRSYSVERDEWEDDPFGLRLYVVGHIRDCDQTPLYNLSFKRPPELAEDRKLLEASRVIVDNTYSMAATLFEAVERGHCEHSLKVLHVDPPSL